MDEVKLTKWRERFEENAKSIQIDYNAFFQNRQFKDIYTIRLDESNEWVLQLNADIPHEIKEELQQAFLAAKPEDSI